MAEGLQKTTFSQFREYVGWPKSEDVKTKLWLELVQLLCWKADPSILNRVLSPKILGKTSTALFKEGKLQSHWGVRFNNFLPSVIGEGLESCAFSGGKEEPGLCFGASTPFMSHSLESNVLWRPWNKETDDQQQNGFRENYPLLSSRETLARIKCLVIFNFLSCIKKNTTLKSFSKGE